MSDNQPRLVRRDRTKGYTETNTSVMSAKAAHLLESYRRAELQRRIEKNDPVPGYSIEEMARAVEWMIN